MCSCCLGNDFHYNTRDQLLLVHLPYVHVQCFQNWRWNTVWMHVCMYVSYFRSFEISCIHALGPPQHRFKNRFQLATCRSGNIIFVAAIAHKILGFDTDRRTIVVRCRWFSNADNACLRGGFSERQLPFDGPFSTFDVLVPAAEGLNVCVRAAAAAA